MILHESTIILANRIQEIVCTGVDHRAEKRDDDYRVAAGFTSAPERVNYAARG